MKPDPAQLKISKEISRSEILFGVARQPNSETLWLGASTGETLRVDVGAEKPEAQAIRGHDSYVSSVLWTPEALVTAGYDGRLIWRDLESGEPLAAVNAHEKWIRSAIVSPDHSKILSVADDMVCRIWDAKSRKLLGELVGHEALTPNDFPSMLYAVACTPDSKHAATADKVGNIYVWNLESRQRVAEMHAPNMYTWDPKARIHSIGGIRSLAFSPDGKQIAAGGIGQIGNIDHLGALARIEVFDWTSRERLHEFPGDTHKGLVEQMAFSPDGSWLLAAGGDHGGFIKAIDLETGKIIKQDKAPVHIHDFVVNESFSKMYASGHGRIVVWEMPLV